MMTLDILLVQNSTPGRQAGAAVEPEIYAWPSGVFSRFGFSTALAKNLQGPYSGYAWMALELIPGALDGVNGMVRYPKAFDVFWMRRRSGEPGWRHQRRTLRPAPDLHPTLDGRTEGQESPFPCILSNLPECAAETRHSAPVRPVGLVVYRAY